MTVTMEGGGLEEFGYPEGTTLLVREDLPAQFGKLAAVEIEDGRVWTGMLGRDESGNPRLETLTCGAYSHRIRRVLGPVLGPLAEDEAEAAEAADDWPDWIPR